MDKPKLNDKSQSQLNVRENIRSDGYNKITQEIEINSGYVNWNLNYADTGALVKIKRERVSYDVRQLDDVSSSEHKICAEIEFETKNSHNITNEKSLVTSIDKSRYF